MAANERRIRVVDYEAAYGVVGLIVSTDDLVKDEEKSQRAGYTILVSETDPRYYISDLEDRLEVNLPNGQSVNIWIGEPKVQQLQEENDGYKLECERLNNVLQRYEETYLEKEDGYKREICRLKAQLYDLLVK